MPLILVYISKLELRSLTGPNINQEKIVNKSITFHDFSSLYTVLYYYILILFFALNTAS